MMDKAIENDVLTGLGSHLIPNGVSLLQYADDTIICLENDLTKARNFKMLLYIYEMMADLKINFMKSEIFMINGDEDITMQYASLFDCQIGTFPILYFGVPVSPNRLHIVDWKKLEEKLDKRLDSWKGSSLSVAGRITLINACLSNSPIYHMSMYLLSNKTIGNLDKKKEVSLARWWRQKKYHLTRWEKAYTSRKKGGLGIKNLRVINICLMCKWLWKFESEKGIWQGIVNNKYVHGNSILNIGPRVGDSPVWSDILKSESIIFKGDKLLLGLVIKLDSGKTPGSLKLLLLCLNQTCMICVMTKISL
jgi:hypothetical protein